MAGETGQHTWHGYALSIHARLAAARARRTSAAPPGRRRRDRETEGILSGKRFVHGARGFLELSLDHVEEAITELEAVQALVDG